MADLGSSDSASFEAHDWSEKGEIMAFLELDDTMLGLVYRGIRDGLTPDELAEQTGAKTSNFVWDYTRIIQALVDRNLPNAPTVALQVARKYRSLLKRDWSPSVRARLQDDLETVETLAAIDAIADATVEARIKTASAEDQAKARHLRLRAAALSAISGPPGVR